MERRVFKLIKEHSEPLEKHWVCIPLDPETRVRGHRAMPMGPVVRTCAEGTQQKKPILLLRWALVALSMRVEEGI